MSRPSDYLDSGFESTSPIGPKLGGAEWLRWAWRQLTSMRTALLLLLALAVAAVPGSLVPQTLADPNGVVLWKTAHKSLVGVANFLQLFDVYSSVWFSAIYLLLFVSLVGCVLPRAKHHLQALRAAPPRTPARLGRLQVHAEATVRTDADSAVAAAERMLRARRYRVRRYGDSVSAERGYLRESGNLVFHLALVGILITQFVGGGFAYTTQRILDVGDSFDNATGYDSITTGRWFSSSSLQNFSLTLKSLVVKYDEQLTTAGAGEPLDYRATVLATDPQGHTSTRVISVNHPLAIGGTEVYLLGNGYAVHVTVRNKQGVPEFSGDVPFIPQDADLTSNGVIKVPDGITTASGRKTQIGFEGFFYPTAQASTTKGVLTSIFPATENPVLSLFVYTGDLQSGSVATSNVYQLNTDEMTVAAGLNAAGKTVGGGAMQLVPKETKELPDGLGTIRFDSVTRFASLNIHHDPTQDWMLLFAILVVAGLLTSLLVPRRRIWMAVSGAAPDGAGLTIEYAALARGDDPGLERALTEFAEEHARALDEPQPVGDRLPVGV